MPSRLSSLAAFLFAAACADPAPSPSPTPHPIDTSHEPRPNFPVDPIPPDEVSSCLAVETGITQVGTFGHDELRDVVVTPTGTILAAGFQNGMLSVPHGMIGSRGVVLAYSGGLNQAAMHAVLDTNGTDAFESIALTPETGRVWLAARTNGDVSDVESRGNYDTVIGDLGPAGGFGPRARGYDSTSERVRQLAIAPDGFLAVAGHEQRLHPDDTTRIHPFLATYTTSEAAVAPQWFHTRRVAGNERYDAVDVSAQMIVVGGAVAEGEGQGMFIATFDRDAGAGWRQRLPDLGADSVAAVKLLPDGNVVWVGTTRNVGEDDGTDIVVGVLAGATGEPLWTRQLGDTGEDRAKDLAVDAQGRIYIVGAANPEGSTDLDAFLLVLDPEGGVVLDERWGSAGDEQPMAVALDGCGAIVIVGHTDGDLGGPSKGLRDGFVAVTRIAEATPRSRPAP